MDFKGKENYILQNPDGSFSPINEPWFQAKKVAEGTYQILSAGDYTYLLEAEEEALVIDTGYGAGNIREFCQSLTTKPVRFAANTHEHTDHTLNNGYFDAVYMTKACHERLRGFQGRGEFEGIEPLKDYPVHLIGDGDVIPIKGRELTVLTIPNHAEGSAAFLDKSHRILFSGDEIMPHTRLNVSVEAFFHNMEKLMDHRKEYDLLCAGSMLMDPVFIDRFYHTARFILDRDSKGLEPLGNPALPCYFPTPYENDKGNTVFPSRRLPRRFGPMGNKDAENKRTLEYADCLITYDIRKIWGS